MNNQKIIRSIGLIIVLSIFALSLAACRNEDEGTDPSAIVVGAEGFTIPLDTAGEITIMTWGGSGEFLRDVGRRDFAPEDISGAMDGAMIATARAFNRYFPNVIINVNANEGDHTGVEQNRENLRLEFGAFPDIFWVSNLVHDVQRGMVADLSIFSNDPMYQAINPVAMDMGRIGGRTFGLPSYMLPWGIFVNRELAERENLDIPPLNWTFDQYLQFVTNSRPNDFYGATQTLWHIRNSGVPGVDWQLAERGPNDPWVMVNSEPVRNILAMLPQVNAHAVWPQYAQGNIDPEFMDANQRWGIRFFANSRLLTHQDDPWFFATLAEATDNPAHWLHPVMTNWDLYPRPATPYVPNHVGIVYDIVALRNFAMDDNDPVLSPEEYEAMQLAWEFMKFKVGDTRAWQERSTQHWGANLAHAVNDTFPVVTGQAFYDQMDLWFAMGRENLRDANRFPGFHRVIELFEDGQFAAFSYKTVPWNMEFEGTVRPILLEWLNMWDAQFAGAPDIDPNWIDELFARLPEWDIMFNERFDAEWAAVEESLARFYPEQQRGGR